MKAKKQAAELAKHGRFGDSALLHVHPQELAGLASLAPGGKLPVNPVTGLPEAFFFLPFLSALAPAAAAGTAAAAPVIAGTTAAAALPAATAIGEGLATGLSAGAGALGGAAAAAVPTATEIASAAIPTATQAATAAGTAASSAVPAAASALPAATSPAGGALAASGLQGFTPAAAGTASAPTTASGVSGALTSPGLTSPTLMGTTQTASLGGGGIGEALGGAVSGVKEGLGSLFGGNSLMKLAPLAMMMRGGGGGGDDDKKSNKKISSEYSGPTATFPDSDYQPGIDPEWNYFPKYASGGIVDLASAPRPNQMQAAGAMQPTPAMPMSQNSMQAPGQAPMMGGGLMQLMQPPAMSVPTGQLDSPYQGAGEAKAAAASGESDKALIAETVKALTGKLKNPDPVILAFVQTFGEKALQDLAARVQQTGGAGDGMSDSIPALIDGNQPAAISSGEYVVPSDVVSGLGNGSTEAGAGVLDQMRDRVRTARHGSPQQPPAINAAGLMPV